MASIRQIIAMDKLRLQKKNEIESRINKIERDQKQVIETFINKILFYDSLNIMQPSFIKPV